jgi:hypothetical protein
MTLNDFSKMSLHQRRLLSEPGNRCIKQGAFFLDMCRISLDRQVPLDLAYKAVVKGTIKTIFPLLALRSPLRAREAPASGREASLF